MEKVNIIRSETWLEDDIDNIGDILDNAIEEFVSDQEEIINIECREVNGLSRFWIYTRNMR